MKLLQTDLSDLQQNKGPKLPSCFSPLVIFPDVQSNHTENYHIKYSIMYDLPEFLGEAGSPQVESVLLWWIHIPVTSLASGLQQDDKLTRTPSYLQERRGRRGGGGGGGELKGGVEMREGKSAGTERRKRKMSTCCIINSLVFLKILCLYFLSLLSLLLPLFLYHFFLSLFCPPFAAALPPFLSSKFLSRTYRKDEGKLRSERWFCRATQTRNEEWKYW